MSTPNPTTKELSRPFGSSALIMKTLTKGKYPLLGDRDLNTMVGLQRSLTSAGTLLNEAHKHASIAHNDIEKKLGQALAKANDAQDRDLMSQHARISKDYTNFRTTIQENEATYQQLKQTYMDAVSTLNAASKSPADVANLMQTNRSTIKSILSDIHQYDKKSRLLEGDILKFGQEQITRVFAQHGIRADLKPRTDNNAPQLS